MRAFYRTLFLASVIGSLLGCAGESRIFQESLNVVRQANKFNDVALATPMLPGYGYLRVHGTSGAILMVWTYLDKDPKSDLPIYVWQAGGGEILKMQEGRIVGSKGFDGDWLAARYQGEPNWTQILANKGVGSYKYLRVVDFKESYQFGRTQQITLGQIPQPAGHELAGVRQPDIVWFEEKVSNNELPPNIYGVVPNWNKSGQAKVAYTWHCFKVDECKGFQVWTTVDQAHIKSIKP